MSENQLKTGFNGETDAQKITRLTAELAEANAKVAAWNALLEEWPGGMEEIAAAMRVSVQRMNECDAALLYAEQMREALENISKPMRNDEHPNDYAARMRWAAIEVLSKPLPATAEEVKDINEAVDFLAVMFDAYENGPDCYEDPEDCSGHLGKAVRLDDDQFSRIVEILNKHRPRQAINAALAAKEQDKPSAA